LKASGCSQLIEWAASGARWSRRRGYGCADLLGRLLAWRIYADSQL